MTKYRQFTALMPGQFLHRHPFRLPAARTGTVLPVIQITAVGAEEWQTQQHFNCITPHR